MTPRQYLGTHNVSRTLSHIVRVMAPTLIALSFATVAHAQGTMDFSGAQTLMGTFKTFAVYAGAVICFGGLIFAGIRMMSGRFQDAIPGLFGALFGAGVLGWGAGWIGFATQRQRRATAGAWRLREEDKCCPRLLRGKSQAIPRPQLNPHDVLRKHIVHIEHNGREASGLEQQICRLQCLL